MSDTKVPQSPDEFYADAVADGAETPRTPKPSEPLVVESNSSNYGASAVTPQHVVADET